MRDAANVFVLYARVPFSLSLSLVLQTSLFLIWWFGIVRKVLSTSRSKMLPDNYSGSKFDNRKPSVKRSARHHHQQQRQRQQRDRFLFCTAVHSSCGEREREREHKATTTTTEKKEEEKQTIRFVKEGNRNEISLSFFSCTNTQNTRTNRIKTKEVKRRRVLSISLLTSLFRTAFFGWCKCNNRVWCKCELWGSPFSFFKVSLLRTKNGWNPKYEDSRVPKTWFC